MGCCQGIHQQSIQNNFGIVSNVNEIICDDDYSNDVICLNRSSHIVLGISSSKEISYPPLALEYKDVLNQGQDSQQQIQKVEESENKQLFNSIYVESLNFSEQNATFSLMKTTIPTERIQSPSKKEWYVNQDIFVKQNLDKNVNDTYQMKELLGQGGFGKVYRVIHKSTGMVRAMKVIPLNKIKKQDEQILLQETRTMIAIDHVNVVKLFEVFKDQDHYYLISEYCDGGELFEKIRNINLLSEKVIASYMKQIFSAIMYCHKMGIVHRDLKPENILFDSNRPDACLKIIDFGASAKLSTDGINLSKRVGTPFYVAPEVLAANYNEKCDIWSMGVILYILICGYPPFFGATQGEILHKVRQGIYQFETNDWAKVSIQAKDLIRLMLLYEPEKRINAQEAYNHPWIQNNKTNGTLQNQALEKLGSFHIKNKLKMAIIEFISVQVVTSQQKKDLQREFQDLDQNGDGMVSKNELFLGTQSSFIKAYNKLYNDKLKAQQIVDEIFEVIDTNQSGMVDFSEFVAAAINNQQKLSNQIMEQSFKLFDLDGNGLITRQEVQELFGGHELDDEMWNEILKECDDNKDGMISQLEFMQLLALKAQKEEQQ